MALETVDFSDPERPKTCLEVDFPILPANELAKVESSSGAGRKPIYAMGKWWARRSSSVFRALLIAAAAKAPPDPAEAAKVVWDAYYGNHQAGGAFSHLKVADIFMGGGTTVVEGARLGMEMYGIDLNPVAWFVVRNEISDVNRSEVEALLADIENEVRPQIMPFYACDCPRGHRGTWRRRSTGETMDDRFDTLALSPEERKDFAYHGPEAIYVFWAKHGPCQVTGCGHRTPLISSPVMAVKTLTVKAWAHRCPRCKTVFDIEEHDARMAPNVPLIVAESEALYAVLRSDFSVLCPRCAHRERVFSPSGISRRKKIRLSLLIHPQWLAGESGRGDDGSPYGGSVSDDVDSTVRWNQARGATMRLLEVRGELPDAVNCPDTGRVLKTGKDGGTVPRTSAFACGSCGTVQDILTAVRGSGKTGPVAAFALQGYCPTCAAEKRPYGGRFFAAVCDTGRFDSALREWHARKEEDLASFWPRQEVPYGFMTGVANGDIRRGHGFTHWWTMFNSRQLLVHSQLLRSVATYGKSYQWQTREFVLGILQRYVQHQNMLCFWHQRQDCLTSSLSNANYHPKSTLVENSIWARIGLGNLRSSTEKALSALDWKEHPWDLVHNVRATERIPEIRADVKGTTSKLHSAGSPTRNVTLDCHSATELSSIETDSYDLVVTDPPFGGLLHYSELADFFYVWLQLALNDRYPDLFSAQHTPKALEVVANRARHPDDPDAFYQRLLTSCWREANRILKSGGLLTFTFHHSEDAPWVAVLESLFDAGFYLEATYPIRSDETKGSGEFGSKKIEYDIIHVCRKRREAPTPVSWARMRRQVIADVRHLQSLLEHHRREGLPAADLQVIRRGKALEYFSRHYGKVYVDAGKPISVREALVGVNQLLDEELGAVADPPPASAEPFTRQFLRLFDGQVAVPRDQIQKFLRGTGSAPADFEDRGWCRHEKKVYHIVPPLEIARGWVGKHRRGMTSDYDQAAFLIGACVDNSGINVTATLGNSNFAPHPALESLLDWFARRGATTDIRNAASRAGSILRHWNATHPRTDQQLTLFDDDEGAIA